LARISSADLHAQLQSTPGLLLIDARSDESRVRSGWIAGSIRVPDVSALEIDSESAIVVYCDCPNDASAAVIARKLKTLGFKRVRPLAGGISGWREQGYPVVTHERE
jgi:rhodanese-related sulfurtransferase